MKAPGWPGSGRRSQIRPGLGTALAILAACALSIPANGQNADAAEGGCDLEAKAHAPGTRTCIRGNAWICMGPYWKFDGRCHPPDTIRILDVTAGGDDARQCRSLGARSVRHCNGKTSCLIACRPGECAGTTCAVRWWCNYRERIQTVTVGEGRSEKVDCG